MSKNELSLIVMILLRPLSGKRKRKNSGNLSLFSGEAG